MHHSLTLTIVPVPPPLSDVHVNDIFFLMFQNGDGFITTAKLRHVMSALGADLTVEEGDEMIRDADFDGDGKVGFEGIVESI